MHLPVHFSVRDFSNTRINVCACRHVGALQHISLFRLESDTVVGRRSTEAATIGTGNCCC